MMSGVIDRIRNDLKERADPIVKKKNERFFKESVLYHGLRNAETNRIAKEYWKEVKPLGKERIFEMCEDLLSSDYSEEAFIVCDWIPNLKKLFVWEDLFTFRRWIDDHLNTWAKVDAFCNHSVGDFIGLYPDAVQELKSWTGSNNRWMRRASAVSLIIPSRRGEYLEDIFEIALMLLEDEDDMVQKGYGWMLKESSKQHREEVFEFVMRNKRRMPRTALRYAIELMPSNMRIEAMS